jgi:hypothetical protein
MYKPISVSALKYCRCLSQLTRHVLLLVLLHFNTRILKLVTYMYANYDPSCIQVEQCELPPPTV